MVKILVFIFFFLFPLFSYTQNFDVRKTTWGMSVKEVLNSESPKIPYKQIDTNFNSTYPVNYKIQFKNVLIGNYISDIDYLFNNGKLVEVIYDLWVKDEKEINENNLYSKVLKVSFIYNFLTREKTMERLYCWSYDNASYKVFSGKTACDFASKEQVDDVEKIGKSINYVEKAIFVLSNKRSNASFEFYIKENSRKDNISTVHFIPSTETNNQLKVNDF